LPPAHLDAEAKAEWARMADDLFKLGLLTRIDRAALAGYCIAYSRSVKAEQMIQKTGELLKSKKTGAFYPNPYLHIANRALKQMKDFLVEFGMTPSSRSRVRATKPTAPSPKARFFQGGA
jgi:P27 family predicted phage terminase small subunit